MDIKPELRENIDWLRQESKGTLESAVGIEFQSYDREKLVATMPVDARTKIL